MSAMSAEMAKGATSPKHNLLQAKPQQGKTSKAIVTNRKSVPLCELKLCTQKRKSADCYSPEPTLAKGKKQLVDSCHGYSPSPFKTKSTLKKSIVDECNNHHSTSFKAETSLTPECYRSVLWDSQIVSSKEGATDTSCAIVVGVRIRPFTDKELQSADRKAVTSQNNDIQVTSDNGAVHVFSFDHCYNCTDTDHPTSATQAHVYDTLAQPVLDRVLEGYNACLFAYGQTGSGKSYSIMGTPDEPGLLPRFCSDLCDKVAAQTSTRSVGIEISYFEIYNEKIHDLLGSSSDPGKKPSLRVREHPVLGPYVVELSTFVVSCYNDLEGWLMLGNKRRATAATGMNDKSSRSHAVFTVVISQSQNDENQEFGGQNCKSRVNLVDLAGSERNGGGGNPSFDRLKEGANINRSLLTLGKVISHLAEASLAGSSRHRKVFVPYRESVLTWLLKDSLGGNSRTIMLATISPAFGQLEETLSTLRYAKQARNIVNNVFVNEDPNAKLIRELRDEIRRLQNEQCNTNSGLAHDATDEIRALKNKLHATEAQLLEATQTWKQKLEQAEKQKVEENRLLEKSGISSKLNGDLPYLVNLNEDPLLSEVLVYVLKKGETRVGRKREMATHQIQLHGSLIAENHCIINYDDDSVKIVPLPDASTYVNGNLIGEPAILTHGDRVVLGGDHYFRFNYAQNQETSTCHPPARTNFRFARHELLQIQDRRFREEMQKEREQTQQKMQQEIEGLQAQAEEQLNRQRCKYEDHIRELRKALDEQQKELSALEVSAHNSEGKQQLPEQEPKSRRISSSESFEHWSPQQTNFVQELFCEMGDQNDTTFIDQSSEMVGSLYELHLKIREANRYCVELHKDVIFSLHEELSGCSVKVGIRVLNTRHGVHTFWDLGKFQNRVNNLKAQAEDHLSTLSDIFNTSDVWFDSHDSPNGYSFCGNNSTLRRESSCNVPPAKTETQSAETCVQYGAQAEECVLSAVANHCRQHLWEVIANVLDGPLQSQGTTVDILVRCCSSVKIVLDKFNVNPDSTEHKGLWPLIVQMRSSLDRLLSACCTWLASDGPSGVDYVEHLKEAVWDLLKELFYSVGSVLQGIDANVISLVQESYNKSSELLCQLCIHVGELSLAQKTPVLVVCRRDTMEDPSVAVAVIHGLSRYMELCLHNCEAAIEDKEMKINLLMDDSFFGSSKNWDCVGQGCQELLASVRIWMQKYTAVQTETLLIQPQYNGPWPTTCAPLSYLHAVQVLELVEGLDARVGELTRQTENLMKGGIVKGNSLISCGQGISSVIKDLANLQNSNLEDFNGIQSASDELELASRDVAMSVSEMLRLIPKTSPRSVSSSSNNSLANTVSMPSSDLLSNSKGTNTSFEMDESSYSVISCKPCCCSPSKMGRLKCPLHFKGNEAKTVRFELETSASLFSSVSGSLEEDESIDL